jgi:hypothetical protein
MVPRAYWQRPAILAPEQLLAVILIGYLPDAGQLVNSV